MKEFTKTPLSLSGKCPTLKGTFYRNGPTPHYPPKAPYHLFDGDGMIHAFEFYNGQIFYHNQWVRTEKYKLENRAGQSLFGGILSPANAQFTFERLQKISNTANTSLVWHHQILYALWEFGKPHALDPETIQTLTGNLPLMSPLGAFSAHPKIDPHTGELIALSYNAFQDLPSYTLSIFSKEGDLLLQRALTGPYSAMVHDIAITEHYILFPLFPAILDLSAPQRISWQPEKGAFLGLISRIKPDESIQWIQIPTCYVYHFINAYEQDETLKVDAVKHECVPLFAPCDASQLRADQGDLVRWSLNLVEGTCIEQLIDDRQYYYFPHCDLRYLGREYHHIFAYGVADEQHILTHFSLEDKTQQVYRAPLGFTLSEPYFVPRTQSALEGEGFVLIIQSNQEQSQSSLLIFDSADLSHPQTFANLPHFIPSGFHGLWRSRG